MSLPQHCSFIDRSGTCPLVPEFVISLRAHDSEYLVAVSCTDHKEKIVTKLHGMQKDRALPEGTFIVNAVASVGTDCIAGLDDDYVDVELNRGIMSDRKLK